MMTQISSHLMMKSMKKPKKSRLNVLLNTMPVKKQRKPRRAKLSPSLTLSSISNHGMMKPISKLWKRVLEVLLWMVSSGVLVNSSQSVMVSKKLQITCVIEDDKVMMDDLEDQVTGFEDFVQSMDIVAFNKI